MYKSYVIHSTKFNSTLYGFLNPWIITKLRTRLFAALATPKHYTEQDSFINRSSHVSSSWIFLKLLTRFLVTPFPGLMGSAFPVSSFTYSIDIRVWAPRCRGPSAQAQLEPPRTGPAYHVGWDKRLWVSLVARFHPILAWLICIRTNRSLFGCQAPLFRLDSTHADIWSHPDPVETVKMSFTLEHGPVDAGCIGWAHTSASHVSQAVSAYAGNQNSISVFLHLLIQPH